MQVGAPESAPEFSRLFLSPWLLVQEKGRKMVVPGSGRQARGSAVVPRTRWPIVLLGLFPLAILG